MLLPWVIEKKKRTTFIAPLTHVCNQSNQQTELSFYETLILELTLYHNIWTDVLGKHGVGKMNINGLRLLKLC